MPFRGPSDANLKPELNKSALDDAAHRFTFTHKGIHVCSTCRCMCAPACTDGYVHFGMTSGDEYMHATIVHSNVLR